MKVYIGESDSVAARLQTHSKDPRWGFWEDTIVVVSKDENLTKSHVAYLEHRFQTLTQRVGRAKLATRVEPLKKLPESDLADMQYFESQVLMLMPVLGCEWLDQQLGQAVPGVEFELAVPKTSQKAAAFESEDGEFVVRAESHARRAPVESLGRNYQNLRQTLEADGKLVPAPDDKTLLFKEDVAFNSPSAAASVVTGAQTNGRDAWKIGGKTYADWDDARVQIAVVPLECSAVIVEAEEKRT